MFERFPTPSEIVFALALTSTTTPAANELLRSIYTNDTIARSCPPLLTEDDYQQQLRRIERRMTVQTGHNASLPAINYIPPEIQTQLDELEHKKKEASISRVRIHQNTTGPLGQKEADSIGIGSGLFAFITAGVKEIRKYKRR